MSKNKNVQTKWKVTRDLSYAAEYMYRLGVKDAAELGDPDEIEEMLHVDDDFSHGQFVRDVPYDIYSKKFFRIYCDEVIVILNRIRCLNLAWFLRDESDDINVKRSMLSLLSYQYRKGISHGIKIELERAKEYFEQGNNGRDHHFLFSPASYKIMNYLDLLKHRCNKIYSIRKREREEIEKPTRSTLILSKFIADACLEFKIGSKKYV